MSDVNPPPLPPPPSQQYSPYGAGRAVPDHPQATTVLVLGIASLFVGILGPVAWYLGGKAKQEIEAAAGGLGGLQQVTIGWILGIVMTVLLVAGLLFFLVVVVLVLGVFASAS